MVARRFTSALGKAFVFKSDVKSDHQVVATTIKFHFAVTKNKRGPREQSYDFDELAFEPRLRDRYSGSFKFHRQKIHKKVLSFDDLQSCIGLAAADVLDPACPPQKLKDIWLDPAVANAPRYKKESAIKNAVRQRANDELNAYSANLTQHKAWYAWKHVKRLRKEAPRGSNTKLNNAAFSEHFKKLLCPTLPDENDESYKAKLLQLKKVIESSGILEVSKNVHWNCEPFTEEELGAAVAGMSNHKSTGPDKIHIEIFRCPDVLNAVLPILNQALITGHLPDEILHATLVPLFKKGSVDETGNYRGISLLSNVVKVLNKILLLRIRAALEAFLLDCQNAYRPERNCIQHMMALQELINTAKRHVNVPLVCLFVDFTKAFDSVDRAMLRILLESWGCPKNICTLIFTVLDGQQMIVRTADGVSEAFTPTSGVLQGDTLAPYLFIIVMDLIFRSVDPQGTLGYPLQHKSVSSVLAQGTISRPKSVPILREPQLAYADDVALLADSCDSAEKLLHNLERVSNLFGLCVNCGKGKTEVMVFNTAPRDLQTLDGRLVSPTDKYKYLGGIVGATWLEDFNHRKKLAWALIHKHEFVWKAKNGGFNAKRRLFDALVYPVLTYSAVLWSWTQQARDTINAALQKMLRHCLSSRINYAKMNHVPTERLLPHSVYFTARMVKDRLNQYGHWHRQHKRPSNTVSHPAVRILLHCAKDKFRETQYKTSRHNAMLQAPSDVLLAMVNSGQTFLFGDYQSVAASITPEITSKANWHRIVESAVLAEQAHVARRVHKRREKEAGCGKRPQLKTSSDEFLATMSKHCKVMLARQVKDRDQKKHC